MPQPIWRKIVERAKVPGSPQMPWTKVLDFVTPGKTMKIEVVVDDKTDPCPCTGKWQPAGFTAPCDADGDFAAKQSGTPLVASAPLGALIARIGGSTADQTIDVSATPSRLVFAVGRHCVFVAPAQTPSGALYLSVNDAPSNTLKLTGNLCVDVYESI